VSQRRVLEAAFVLLEFSSPSRRIFIGSHSLPPSLVRRIGPSLLPWPLAPCLKWRSGAFSQGCAGEASLRRRAGAPLLSPVHSPPRPAHTSPGPLDRWSTASIKSRGITLRCGPPWTRAPSPRHGPHHHGRWIEDPRLNRAIFFKGPLDFYVFACRSLHLYKSFQTNPESYVLAPAFSVK
jgi:hypothetical protein